MQVKVICCFSVDYADSSSTNKLRKLASPSSVSESSCESATLESPTQRYSYAMSRSYSLANMQLFVLCSTGASAALELSVAKSRWCPKVVLSHSRDDLIHPDDRYTNFNKNYDRYYIKTMCYNSLRDELFFVDYVDTMLRSIHLRERWPNLVNLSDRRKFPTMNSVCYISDSETLALVTESRDGDSHHVMVLTRIGEGSSSDEWRKADCQLIGSICCAVSDSRLLIGTKNVTYMELFRVESGPRVTLLHRINVPEVYFDFSVRGSAGEELVAVSYKDSVCVNRLCHNRLEEISRIQLSSRHVLWLADRLLVTERIDSDDVDSHVVVELEVRGTRLERCRELLDLKYARIYFHCWCAVGNELAIFDGNMNALVLYSFD